jgi:hypothetical protein
MLEKLAAAHNAGKLTFFDEHAHLADEKAFAAFLAPLRRRRRWFVYAKRPSLARRRCSPTCRATPTASQSPTVACSQARRERCHVQGQGLLLD